MAPRRITLFAPFVPLGVPEAVHQVLASGQLAQGPMVHRFEQAFKETFTLPYAVAVNSGTSALETAYDILELGPGDEVITSPLTCTATNLPLLRRDCRLVWADVLPETLCLDPNDAQRKLTSRTKAIVQVHLGGIRAEASGTDFDGVPIVSDAAQALGIFQGDFTCCSFQAIKHLTTGDGGMLVPMTLVDEHQAKLLRWFGIDRERHVDSSWESYKTRMMTCEPRVLGGKRHMNDVTAAMGLAALPSYAAMMAHRHTLFEQYREGLDGVDGITLLDSPINAKWLCTVLVERRDAFAKMLYAASVEVNVVQIRNDRYPIFGGLADLPQLASVEDRYVCLPLGMHVVADDVAYILDCIRGGW